MHLKIGRPTENSGTNCYKFSLWRSKHHKTSQPSFSYKEANKTQALWAQQLWQEAQEISLHVKSPNLFVSIYCLYTQQIKTRPAPFQFKHRVSAWLSWVPTAPGHFWIQSPFWLLSKGSRGSPRACRGILLQLCEKFDGFPPFFYSKENLLLSLLCSL